MVSLKDCCMKKHLLFISLFTLIAGCDAPQRTRAPQAWINGSSLENPTNQSGTLTNTGPGTSRGSSTTNDGFQNCDLSNKYQTIDIGWFGICQSSLDETIVKFKPSLTSTDIRTCLIPTYKAADGSSTYLGQPQCTYTTSNTTVQGKLYKDRSGFSSYPLNGVIVMKEPLLPEYFNCMQAYVNWPVNVCPSGATNSYCSYWISACPYGAKTGSACEAQARDYMNQSCSSFKSKYSNSYLDISLK